MHLSQYIAEIFDKTQWRSIRAQYLSRAAQDLARYDSLRHVHVEPEVCPPGPWSERAVHRVRGTNDTIMYAHVRNDRVSIQ